MKKLTARLLPLSVGILLASCANTPSKERTDPLLAIGHIIIIYAENRSFDHLYGLFPGANGIAQARPEQYLQIDHDGKVFNQLPPIPASKDGKYPAINVKLPNKPFRIDQPPVNLPVTAQSRDLVHRFYQSIEQINGGKNNRFAAISDAGGLVMGHYDGAILPMWQWAKDYVLADNFFMGAFGGSYLNHQWLVCACTPTDPTAPEKMRAQIDGRGLLKRKADSPASALEGPPLLLDGILTPDGYSVNSQQPPYQPSGLAPALGGDLRLADPALHPLPPQTNKTIGDTLSEKGISWAWYAGGWDAAVTDGTQAADKQRQVIYNDSQDAINFQAHHQPFNYFASFAPGTTDRTEHLKDGDDFIAGIAAGKLPQVSFYKPAGHVNEHPGYTDVLSGDQHIHSLLERIRQSPLWPDAVIIITYDENGGFWDHVAPPKGDRWGPGTRVPAIIVSPLAKRGFIDHTAYDTTSIIKFITRRFNLEPLPGVRDKAGDLTNAFAFGQ